MALGALIGSKLGASVIGAGMNAIGTSMTNRTNLQIARETNAANAEQADLAYRRSLPVNQVANLVAAGMSKAGALSSLTGGGSYTPASMTGPTMQRSPLNDLGAAFDKVSEIPANVMQQEMTDANLRHINQQMDFERNDEKRKQEMHDFDKWQKQYGQKTAQMIDSVSSYIYTKAANDNINLDNIDSVDKLVKLFNLSSNKDWLNMPKMARDQLLQQVRSQASENRAIANEKREQERHEIQQKISKESLQQLKNANHEYIATSDARKKELNIREMRASIEEIMTSIGLDEAELKQYMRQRTRKDGSHGLSTNQGMNVVADEFWNTIGHVVGLEYVGGLLSRIFPALVK